MATDSPQKKLQLWHQRLGNLGHDWVQDLMHQHKHNVGEPLEQPLLPTPKNKTSTCDAPKCAACQLVKQHRIGVGDTTTSKKPGLEMAICRDDLQPGDCISTDQFTSANPGRLLHTYGKEGPARQYHGGTLFYDYAFSYLHLSNQESLGMGETLLSKDALNGLHMQVGSTSSPAVLITIRISPRSSSTT
jgi:alpha-ketoglutarate-dependent taurine dioxygenase